MSAAATFECAPNLTDAAVDPVSRPPSPATCCGRRSSSPRPRCRCNVHAADGSRPARRAEGVERRNPGRPPRSGEARQHRSRTPRRLVATGARRTSSSGDTPDRSSSSWRRISPRGTAGSGRVVTSRPLADLPRRCRRARPLKGTDPRHEPCASVRGRRLLRGDPLGGRLAHLRPVVPDPLRRVDLEDHASRRVEELREQRRPPRASGRGSPRRAPGRTSPWSPGRRARCTCPST